MTGSTLKLSSHNSEKMLLNLSKYSVSNREKSHILTPLKDSITVFNHSKKMLQPFGSHLKTLLTTLDEVSLPETLENVLSHALRSEFSNCCICPMPCIQHSDGDSFLGYFKRVIDIAAQRLHLSKKSFVGFF